MTEDRVAAKLVQVLRTIQSNSGYDAEGICLTTCPLNDLKGFDSQLWPVAITMLADALDVTIPNNKNIYVSDDGRRRLTIAESAVVVCGIATEKEK
jgi:hypothetical protein